MTKLEVFGLVIDKEVGILSCFGHGCMFSTETH